MKLRNQRGTACHNSKRGLGCADPAINKSTLSGNFLKVFNNADISRSSDNIISQPQMKRPAQRIFSPFQKARQLRRVSNAILSSLQGTQMRVVLSESRSPGERKTNPLTGNADGGPSSVSPDMTITLFKYFNAVHLYKRPGE